MPKAIVVLNIVEAYQAEGTSCHKPKSLNRSLGSHGRVHEVVEDRDGSPHADGSREEEQVVLGTP